MNKNVLFIIFLIFIRLKYIFLIYLNQDIKKNLYIYIIKSEKMMQL